MFGCLFGINPLVFGLDMASVHGGLGAVYNENSGMERSGYSACPEGLGLYPPIRGSKMILGEKDSTHEFAKGIP